MRDLTLLTDLYELTMMQGFFEEGMSEKQTVFDMTFRFNPCGNGYSVFCGLEQLCEYIESIRFNEDEIEYLRSLELFTPAFLTYLNDFKFSGEIFSVPEGTPVFPGEPIVRVRTSIMEAAIIESALLNIINHQSLIATKAARIIEAAAGGAVMEFGLRRAQGPDASIYGARAAVIGGCVGTSNVLAAKMFDVPPKGTHAHSWVMSFPDELTAFRAFARVYPNDCLLLVDTYDTIRSGVPNAITVFKEMLEKGNPKSLGIRLDSGDLAYLSKYVRKMLDEAGLESVKICASNDLDEDLILSLKQQGAMIDVWGVGTNLITSKGCSAFGGVYKLSAECEDGTWIPRIKISDNPEKVTTPGVKKVYRIFDKANGKIKADLVALEHEIIDMTDNLTLFDPSHPWRQMTLEANSYAAIELLVPIFIDGKRVYNSPSVMEIRDYCEKQKETLWDECRRLTNPHEVPVDLTDELFRLKKQMIYEARQPR